jgi:hypothetical protein
MTRSTPAGIPAAVAAGLLSACSLLGPPTLDAQDWAARAAPSLGAGIGTSGLGVEAAIRPWTHVGLRLGVGWIPVDFDFDEDDFSGSVSPPSPITRVTADFFPFRGRFYLSAGLHHYAGGVSGRAMPTDSVELSDRMYSAEEVGRATARVWGNETAPYLGLGWQGRGGRVQPYLDLGVAFTGEPRITVDVTGPIAEDPQFRSDLDREIRDAEDEIARFRYFPHVAFGLRFRLGG